MFPPLQEEVLAECTSARPLDEERLEKAIDDLAKTVADVREGPEFDDLKVTCAVRPGSRRTPRVIPPPRTDPLRAPCAAVVRPCDWLLQETEEFKAASALVDELGPQS